VWNGINTTVRFTPHDDAQPFRTAEQIDRSWIEQREAEPWRQLKRRGVGVMVGEFGAYKETPHDVVLRWMEDCLKTWQKAGMGWALWNLRGDFGILDSGRRDVVYEDFEGHKLDRKMLELLQKY
jgi:endoglucanase